MTRSLSNVEQKIFHNALRRSVKILEKGKDKMKDEWMDIRTAPRNKTEILLWSEFDGMHLGKFAKVKLVESFWVTVGEGILAIESQDDQVGTEYLKSSATHWRPLPNPPAFAVTKGLK